MFLLSGDDDGLAMVMDVRRRTRVLCYKEGNEGGVQEASSNYVW